MSDLLKVIIGLSLWLLIFLLGYNFWRPGCNQIPGCSCTTQTATTAVVPPVTQQEEVRAPLDCQWSEANGYTNNGFEDFKANILSGLGDNNILEITGNYYEGEENTTEFENIGLARANHLKTLFMEAVEADRIQLSSNKIDRSGDAKSGYYSCADFNWIETAAAETNGSVEILEDGAIIRFPYNSVEKEVDPKIDAYLETLATQLKENGTNVRLTGHTDDRGGEERNEILAHRRAKMIRDILREKGVKRSQILTFTKGETEPLATNATEEGRRENRRVEVQIN